MVEEPRQQPSFPPIPQPLEEVRLAVFPWKVTALVTTMLLVLAVIAIAALIVLNGSAPMERLHYEMLKAGERDIKVDLPDMHERRTALNGTTGLIVINVRGEARDKEDALYVVSRQTVNLLQLRKIVADGVEGNKNQKVLIRGDKYALHLNVANAVSVCRDGGVIEANIGYDYVPVE
ncbi:MAG: hypothetical protein QGH60_00990 [Phycisphaerae bacterium]|jgi:biopolymer transport protein ExbD|nr:hypothetical protein [Phycisphaerae bacterium]